MPTRTPFTSLEIRQLLEIVLNHGNYFVFMGEFYKMNNMGPIGNSVMTVGSECFLQYLESMALNPMNLQLAGFSTEDFDFWIHYVDVLDQVNEGFNLDDFLNYLNSYNPRIQFTAEVQEENGFNFLDIKILINSNNTISTAVFKKKTHKFVQFFHLLF